MNSLNPSVDLFSVLFLLGAAQGLFLVLALLTVKRGALKANRVLALFTLVFAITLVDIFLEYTRYYTWSPWLLGVIWPTNFFYGPLLLFYAHALLNKPETFKTKNLFWNFLPVVVSGIVLLPWFALPDEVKVTAYYGDLGQMALTWPPAIKRQLAFAVIVHGIVALAAVIHIGVYLLVVLISLRQHRKRIKEQFSYTNKISLNWLRNITYIGLILWVVLIFSEWIAQYLGVEQHAYYGMHVLIAVFIYTMGYLGLKQPVIFHDQAAAEQEQHGSVAAAQQAHASKVKYEKSSLDDAAAAQLARLLQDKMRQHRLYLDQQLSLTRLADCMETSPHYLSQAINGHLGKNFFDFVNEYRIEEAKSRIAHIPSGRMNVLGIALDSGFSSKSAFYTAFKRYTGMTPGEYKNALAADDTCRSLIH